MIGELIGNKITGDNARDMLKNARISANKTQKDLSEVMNISENGFGKRERNYKLIVDDVYVMCMATDLPPTELFGIFGPLFSLPSDNEDFFELSVKFEADEDKKDPIWGFSDRGYSVSYSRQEWAMHKLLCQHLGLGNPLNEEAVKATSEVFKLRRLRAVKGLCKEN